VIIAVLGGGNGSYATAADLALAGHRVRLWRRAGDELKALGTPPTITLTAEERSGPARLDAATPDLARVVEGADVVIAPLPATAHADLAHHLAPHLTERQVVLLTPGTFGALAMAQDVTRAKGGMPYAFAETGTLPYLARKTGPAAVSAPVRAANLPVGVFPASRSEKALETIRTLFPATRPCRDALDVALTNAGPVIHPPLVLGNLGAIDGGQFDVHAGGTTPSVRTLIDAVDAERLATRNGWGYPAPHYELATHYDEARAGEGLYGRGARARLLASGLWNEILGLDHRYVVEDAVLGLSLFESAARTTTVATRATSGLLAVFGALLGRELSGQGRALEHLGLGDLSLREIKALLHDGWLSPLWSRVVR
jgi:opine dehydrogenase